MTPETSIKKRILQYLSTIPNLFFISVPVAGGFSKHLAGFTDILVIYKGLFIGLEVKSDTGKQREVQKIMQQRIEHAGGIYALVRSVEDVEHALCSIGL